MEKQDILNEEKQNEDYLSRINNNFSILSKNEKRVAQYVLTHQKDIVQFSITSLARRMNTSTSTITRFCQKLHYNGFSELKYQIKHNIAPFPVGGNAVSMSDTVHDLKYKLAALDADAVKDSMINLNDLQLQNAAMALIKARNIIIYAEGGPGASAEYAYQLFFQIGLPCHFFTDTQFALISAMQLTAEDTVVCISRSGEPKNMSEAWLLAKQNGATLIGITADETALLAKISRISLCYTSRLEDDLRYLHTARICELAILGLLQSIIINSMDADAARQRLNTREAINLGRISTHKSASMELLNKKKGK